MIEPAFASLVDAFDGMRALVIGDAMLDSYVRGSARRLTREAPVPVVDVMAREETSGGAANTALNLAALGAHVTLLSVVGDDQEGIRLLEAIEACGVDTSAVAVQPGRETLAKQRIVAQDQLVVRVDQGTTDRIDAATEADLLRHLERGLAHTDAIVVSDYGYGVLTPAVIAALGERKRGRVLVVDARDLARYRLARPTAAKPNYDEAIALLGIPEWRGTESRALQLAQHGASLLRRTGAQLVAATMDVDGALMLEPDQPPYRTYAQPAAAANAAGAGDTYLGALALALAAGGTAAGAAEVASAAAAAVVRKPGTSVCTLEELRGVLLGDQKMVPDMRLLAARAAAYHQQGARVVFTNGCFDLLHRGHVTYLNRAKALGDVLIVGVNSDASTARLKGSGRPINPLEDRLQVLSALSCVDHVVAFEEDTPAALIEAVRPDIFVKGGDYTYHDLPEAPLVEALGGSIQILPYLEDRSTTRIINRIGQGYRVQDRRATA